jgi:hypothetical protein
MKCRIQGKHTALCSHPGCAKTIREESWNFTTGFCTAHQPVAAIKAKPQRVALRKVTVHLTPTCSSLASRHVVTMPAYPWEAP